MTYKVAVIDPPWQWLGHTGETSRSPLYAKLTDDDLCALPMSRLLAPHAVVLLWIIDTHIPHALRCLEAWGLTYKTVGFYWTKVRPSGKEHLGLGYYTRANPEQCWIATRGAGLPRVSRSVRRWLHAPSGAHSEKPDAFYAAVETLFGDVPRVDVFARKQRPGWDAIGNEIDGRDIREVLGQLDA